MLKSTDTTIELNPDIKILQKRFKIENSSKQDINKEILLKVYMK